VPSSSVASPSFSTFADGSASRFVAVTVNCRLMLRRSSPTRAISRELSASDADISSSEALIWRKSSAFVMNGWVIPSSGRMPNTVTWLPSARRSNVAARSPAVRVASVTDVRARVVLRLTPSVA